MKDDFYDFWKNRVVHSTKLEFFTSQKSIYSQERYLSAVKKLNTDKLFQNCVYSLEAILEKVLIFGVSKTF